MLVYVNGEETELAEQQTIADLIAGKGLNPNAVVVEHNMTILPKEKWQETALSAGDKVEIVAFVGGG